MFKHSKYLCTMLLTCVSLQTQAAANKIESFDTQTWQHMQKDLPRPAVVIFSTTDCAHCPAIINAMAEQVRTRKPQVPVIVVVMDGEGHADLLQEPHYQPANRVLVFKGQTAALQYSINPNWRGITPYVVLFPRFGEMMMVMGKPSALEIKGWLNDRKK